MNTVEVLKAARSLIENPQHWTQEAAFRNAEGLGCRPEDAVSYCALGALDKASNFYEDTKYYTAEELLDQAADELYGGDIITANDNREHYEVLQVFDLAIQLAEKEEA